MENENVKKAISTRQFMIVDGLNVNHQCILAAVLFIEKGEEEKELNSYRLGSKYFTTIKKEWIEKTVLKKLYFGLSITNPTDSYDFEKGKMIAVGRALKPSKSLGSITTESKYMLNTEMVEALLDERVKFITSNVKTFLKSNGPAAFNSELIPIELDEFPRS